MKRNMNIRLGFSFASALLIATMFASCTKVEFEEPSAKFSDEIRFGISTKNNAWKPDTKSADGLAYKEVVARDPNDMNSLGLSMTVIDGIENPLSKTQVNIPATKGTQMNTVPSFDVASYFYAENSSDGVIYFTDQVTNGVNTSSKRYYWPNLGHLNFVATYPSGLFGEAGIQTIADDSGNLQPFEYTVPSDVTKQQDLMIAVTNEVNNSKTDAPVPLEFQHLLAAVQFKVGEMQFIKINSITLSGVKGGTVTFEPTYENQNYKWSVKLQDSPTLMTYEFSLEDNTIVNTEGLPSGSEITGNSTNSILFVVPQEVSAKIKVNYTAMLTGETLETQEVALPTSTSWEAGKTTIYSLNIGTTFDVEIPTPPNQDAHYIMLKMPYKMGALSDYITSVTATAQWIENSNSTESGISLLFEENLSDRQENGFWVDEQWVRTVTVQEGEGKNIISDTTKVADIRGTETLQISGNALESGTIVLFIEENNGDQDRLGELVLTATLSQGGTVVLGRGEFKQLCPCWNDNGLGVERIEDNTKSPYGFAYNRKVTYKLNIVGQYFAIVSWFAAGSLSNIAPDDGTFIKYNYGPVGFFGWTGLQSIEINYSSLNNITTVASDDEGKVNTLALYKFTGGVDFDSIETELNNSAWLSSPTVTGTSSTPANYAAYIALSRNRMYELKTITKASGQDDVISYNAVLYRDSNNKEIVDWYLPSSVESATLKEIGTTDDGSGISPLHGEYWSSTAGDDAQAYAHSFTYENNEFERINESKGRMEDLKVRAVRKKPTTN